MKLTVIEELKKAKPKRRPDILHKIHDRNMAFFKKRNPPLGEALEKMGTGGFVLRFNDEFLDIIEQSTNQYAHPQGKLLEYIEKVASWHHSGWIDKMEVLHRITGDHEHGKVCYIFYMALLEALPQVAERMGTGIIQLPKMPDGRRFSGSTVFLGVLTGLHIVHYLNSTEVRDIFIIEPDIHKFALSCWFVDYAALEKRFGRLVLHVGEDMPESPLDYLMGASPIVAGVWLRMLKIYPSPYFDQIIARTNLRWRSIHEIIVPYDRELRNLCYGAANLRAGFPILSRTPQLSANCRIAVVGSGPSLENDIPWLQANRDKIIIFAVHSSIRVLRKHGITPDFQVTLDTELLEDLPKLQLDTDIPFIVYYKVDPRAIEGFKTVLMLQESNKANAVKFNTPCFYTHPTSGNTAVAAALFMRAKETYLLGLDLGFRDAARSHAGGTWHDDDGGVGHEDAKYRENILTEANFEASESEIFTHSYYNYSRFSVEHALASLTEGCKAFNLSDGVRIQGAEPLRSSEIMAFPDYPDRENDLLAIHGAFVSEAHEAWVPYDTNGAELLREMSETLLSWVETEKPDWLGFAKSLDSAWGAVMQKNFLQHPNDIRIEVYSRLIQDLLSDWMRVTAFTRTPAEFKSAYAAGLKQLKIVLGNLKWPAKIDFRYDAKSESRDDLWGTEVPTDGV